MHLLGKKDIGILLHAGFDESSLGLVPGSMRGVEIYEAPDDYFARELIENACEQGECSLFDEVGDLEPERTIFDDSHKGIYADVEYAGYDDPAVDADPNMRRQIDWLKNVRLRRMNIWQKKVKGLMVYGVKYLHVRIPPEEEERMKRMSPGDQKILWKEYAKDEWKRCWMAAVDSLWEYPYDSTAEITTSNNKDVNIVIISADNLIKMGYYGLPQEARWISMIYFYKFKRR